MSPFRPLLAAFLGLLVACGDTDPGSEAPIIRHFSVEGVSSARIEVGRPVVLAWEVSNAEEVRLEARPGGLLRSGAPLAGTFRTGPIDGATSFVLSAKGPGGEASKVVDVDLDGDDAIRVVSFLAVPAEIGPGESTSLSWEVQRAEHVRIDTTRGEAVLDEDDRALGTVNVTPAVTETYLLTAAGRGGPAVAAVTVVVRGSPRIVVFRAEPAALARGQSTRLIYRVENADRVTLLDGSGAVLSSSDELAAEVEVRPLETEQFRLVVSRANFPELDRELTVTVTQPPGARWRSVRTSSVSVEYGEPVTTWFEAENAPDGVRASYRARAIYSSPLAVGTFTFTPTVSGTLELWAENTLEGSVHSEIPIEVLSSPPRILSLVAEPALAVLGRPFLLRFEVRGADTLSLEADASASSLDLSRGEVMLVASSTLTRLRLTAANPHGASIAELEVPATDQPVIDAFSVEPEVFDGLAVTATVSYAVRNASTLELSGPAGAWARFPTPFASVGTWNARVTSSSLVRVRAENAFGFVRVWKSIAQLVPERESNDTPAEAQPLSGDGGGVRGALDTALDVDLYRLSVPAGGRIEALLGRHSLGCADTLGLELSLLGPDGFDRLAEGAVDDAGACLAIRPERAPGAMGLETGEVLLQVRGASPAAYVLTASVSAGF